MKSFREFITESKGVGKDIGGCIYVHKDYASTNPKISSEHLEAAKKVLSTKHPDHRYNIIKYSHTGLDKGSVSFIHSPDFDESDEPISGDSVKVKPSGETKTTWQKKDPSIYHHKHQFVGDDYRGFDTAKSKERSKRWGEVTDQIKKERPEEKVMSKIGTKSYWEREVVPHIKGD